MTETINIQEELNAALHLHRQGQLDAAAKIYRRVHDSNGDNVDACYGLGTVLLHQHKFSEAAALLEKAVQLEPDVPEFVFNHAMVLDQLGRPDDALKGYLRAAELSAGDALMLPTICQKLISANMADAALYFLGTIQSPTAEVLAVAASAQSAKNDWGGAAVTLRQAAQLSPKNLAIWRQLSIAHGKRREYADAIDAFESYLELKTPDAGDYLAYADLLFMARRPTDSREILDKAMAGKVDEAAAHLLAAKCARLDGDYALARQHLTQAIENKPTFGDAWQLKLETENDESLPEFASECADLGADDSAAVRDRIVLALTAGRAFERAEQFEMAFAQFEAGKTLQKTDQATRGLHYDRDKIEQFAARIKATCDAPFTTSSKKSAELEPIFVLGMPRSGTTLVEKILGGLEGVVTGGESESLEFIASQYYWDLEHGRVVPPRELKANDWDGFRTEYWRRLLRSPTRMTDKMPHNYWHVGFICAMFPATSIVYMRRDPRDVCQSIYSRMFSDGHLYATGLESLAHYYAVSLDIMEHWKSLFPERVLEVVYEDLVLHPEQETQKIAAHCGLDWRPECLDFHSRLEASYTFSEMQVREPLNKKGIGAWQRYERQLQPLVRALQDNGALSAHT
jgi:tetratricopeptide (TPR) repeat protein